MSIEREGKGGGGKEKTGAYSVPSKNPQNSPAQRKGKKGGKGEHNPEKTSDRGGKKELGGGEIFWLAARKNTSFI